MAKEYRSLGQLSEDFDKRNNYADLTISDDSVGTFDIAENFGMFTFMAYDDSGEATVDVGARSGMLMFSRTTLVANRKNIDIMQDRSLTGQNLNIASGVPTGTTGADGAVTIFTSTTNPDRFWVENRSGSELSFRVGLMTAI